MAGEFWLDSKAACAYVGCKTIGGWYAWRKRHGIVKRANNTVNRADLDRALRYRPVARGGSVRHPNSLANLRHVKEATP